ncbi:hypothetical protein EDC01DRAFT_641443 [Geopyxis carbonaria]|nr:hypothetical protein EDC01DRAFT_641443 [Geopyxis carbonaria]
MAKGNTKPWKKNSMASHSGVSGYKPKIRRNNRGAKSAYRSTTLALLKTFPELPTGPSSRKRQNTQVDVPYGFKPENKDSCVLPTASANGQDIAMGCGDDYYPADDDGIFSGNSCDSPMSLNYEEQPWTLPPGSGFGLLAALPGGILKKTLLLLNPADLTRLQRCSKSLNRILTQENIWQHSRNQYLPDFPKPVLGLSEAKMLELFFGTGCMLCQNKRETFTYWAFRIRCCKECFSANTTREHTLLSGSEPFSEVLLSALPFGVVDDSDCWVSSTPNFQPTVGAWKIYWNRDIENIVERYTEVKEMLAEEEWLKGLDSERDAHMQDIQRIEKFERLRSMWFHRGRMLATTHPMKVEISSNGTHVVKPESTSPRFAAQRVSVSLNTREHNPLPADDFQPLDFQRATEQDNCQTFTNKTSIASEITRGDVRVGAKITAHNKLGQVLTTRDEPYVDQVQILTRTKLATHADEIARQWNGRLSKDTVPMFAVDALRYCRQEFFADESTKHNRLTLEDMKFVFDTKIKPLVSPHQPTMKIFLCNGCPKFPRWWCFEPLLQHFWAKHVFHPKGKLAKVGWGTNWPDIGPFRSDLQGVALDEPNSGWSFAQGITSIPLASEGPSLHAQRRAMLKLGHNNGGPSLPIAPSHGKTPSQIEEDLRLHKLDVVASDAQDAWLQLSGISELTLPVHIHFVITRTARKFQTRFSESLSLPLFQEALKGQSSMQTIRGTDASLGCLECQKQFSRGLENNTSKSERLFSLSALLQHFDTMHMKRAKLSIAVDWTREMVKLPHPRKIAALVDSVGIDTSKRQALEDIFPWAFATHLVKPRRDPIKNARSAVWKKPGSGMDGKLNKSNAPPQSGPRVNKANKRLAPYSSGQEALGRQGFKVAKPSKPEIPQSFGYNGNRNSRSAASSLGRESDGFPRDNLSRSERPSLEEANIYTRTDRPLNWMDMAVPHQYKRLTPELSAAVTSQLFDNRVKPSQNFISNQVGGSDDRRSRRPSAADFMDTEDHVSVYAANGPRQEVYQEANSNSSRQHNNMSRRPSPSESRQAYAQHRDPNNREAYYNEGHRNYPDTRYDEYTPYAYPPLYRPPEGYRELPPMGMPPPRYYPEPPPLPPLPPLPPMPYGHHYENFIAGHSHNSTSLMSHPPPLPHSFSAPVSREEHYAGSYYRDYNIE